MKIIKEEKLFLKYKNIKITTLDVGGLINENKIDVAFNMPIRDANNINCPHLGPKYIVSTKVDSGCTYGVIYADCHRVIVSKEDYCGPDSICCLDCILDQLPKIDSGELE